MTPGITKTAGCLVVVLSIICLSTATPTNATTIAEYTKAIEQSLPDYKYKYYLYRGQAYLNENQAGKALKDLNSSIKLKPTIQAYRERGILLYNMRQYKAAIGDFNQYLKRKDDIDIYRKRSFARYSEKSYKKAMGDAKKVLAVQPEDKLCQKILMECETAIQNLPDLIVVNSAPPPRYPKQTGRSRANKTGRATTPRRPAYRKTTTKKVVVKKS